MTICIKAIGERGEIVIPKRIREEKGLKPNAKIEIITGKNGILLVPVENDFRKLRGLFGELSKTDIKKIDLIYHELLAR
ncbi:AbrB/MazE/SpoVT family DNA-binding domain-containing protein [Candidatus Woesearchaeota archaeon]|nr:AbrB/MazE/SpoVT family DNA-binding domain-containing protein [Candidatus Woesearchaeota archaeon]